LSKKTNQPEEEPLDSEADAGTEQPEGETPLDAAQDPPAPEPEVFDNTNLQLKEVMNIDYCVDDGVKKELQSILDLFKPMTDVQVKISSGHDMVCTRNHKQVLRLTPLKRGLSASLNGGKIERWSAPQIIGFVKSDFQTLPTGTPAGAVAPAPKAPAKTAPAAAPAKPTKK